MLLHLLITHMSLCKIEFEDAHVERGRQTDDFFQMFIIKKYFEEFSYFYIKHIVWCP